MPYNPALYYPQPYQPMPQQYAQPTQAPAARVVEVIPVDSEQVAVDFPVAVGTTVVMFSRDDKFIAVKSNGVNGQSSIDFFDRRPPAPPAPAFDLGAYVTRDELDKRLAALLVADRGRAEEASV